MAMKKRVIDVHPPTEKRRKEKERNNTSQKDASRGSRGLLVGIILFLLFLAGYLYYISYQTRVVIEPVTESFSEEKEILARSLGSIGEEEIRGAVKRKTLSRSEEFPIEERRVIEEKAEGEIEVCQDHTQNATNYREGTRFVSDGGKLFVAKEAFVIPGKDNGEGCVSVEVEAGKPGENHNISSDSKFALPGLEGTAIYGRVKGKSFSLTKEGVYKEVPHLGEEGMRQAEVEMSDGLLEEGIKKIREEYGQEYFLESDAQFQMSVVERSSEELEEDEESFRFELIVEVEAIGIGRENTENFIKNLLPEGYTWRKNTEEVGYNFVRTNFEDREADVVLSFSADIYKDFNKETLKREIVGSSFEEAREKIEEKVDVEELSIRTFPFGLSRVAGTPERIRVDFKP